MRLLRSLALLPLLAGSLAAMHCGGSTLQGTGPDGGNPTPDGGPIDTDGGGADPNPDAKGNTTSGKVDLLLVVDNSASMGDKAQALSASIGTLLRKVTPGHDVHVAVISSSLGGFGGDVCPDSSSSLNGRAHLRTDGPDGPVAAAAGGFLNFTGGDVEALVTDTQTLVRGVGQNGCGLEAQLETAYRFLVQPDPWQSVSLDSANQAQLDGIDDTVLAQRKAFLRPDSLVAVVMLTDEDDSTPDPLSVGGQGWAFAANQFPGSTVFRPDGKSTTAPRATSTCQTNPASEDCTSCAFAATCDASTAACIKLKADPECQKNGGYYGPGEDPLNVRFQRMKERYGIDPQYPIARYIDGFTKQRAPNRAGEHVEKARGGGGGGRDIAAYSGTANCTNPLFAASLPGSAAEEGCKLPQGPRGKELVVFALIGGLPPALGGANPNWTKVLGSNPDAFDHSGIDPHMIQSTTPRAGLIPPSQTVGDNGSDPVNGREWDTNNNDLQFACTFALAAPRTCASSDPSCDCGRSGSNPPLCAPGGQQTRGKAYPTVRELRVAKALGDRGVVGSVCAGDAAQGYTATMAILADRIGPRLQ